MDNSNRKQKLLQALIAEKEAMIKHHGSGFTAHDKAIEYLQTGILIVNYDSDDMLYSVVDDFDTICHDYGIE